MRCLIHSVGWLYLDQGRAETFRGAGAPSKGAHGKRLICRHRLKLQFAVEGVAAVRGMYRSETRDIKRNGGEILAD